jgi:hypothetical protein
MLEPSGCESCFPEKWLSGLFPGLRRIDIDNRNKAFHILLSVAAARTSYR